MSKFEIDWLEDRSDEAVLAEIRRVAALTPDRRLTKDKFNSLSKISASAVEVRFGSWGEATRRANLVDALPIYTNDAILEDLRRVSDEFPGEKFTVAFYSVHGRYSRTTISRRFGGWPEALAAAGIHDRFTGPRATDRMRTQPGRTVSNDEILVQIREVAARLNKSSLSGEDIVANSEISQSQLYRRFGGVSAALKQAGVEQVSHGRRHTEEEVFENLLRVWTHYGRPPTVSEMDKPPSTVGKNTYLHRYGGWRKALKVFVQHANAEAIADPSPSPPKASPKHVNRAAPVKSPTPSTVDPSQAQSANKVVVRPRASKSRSTIHKPEDMRNPKIGLRFKVLQRDLFRCLLCGRSPATELGCELHVDHIIPFSKGGKTTLENLQTLCSKCNIGKSNRMATP